MTTARRSFLCRVPPARQVAGGGRRWQQQQFPMTPARRSLLYRVSVCHGHMPYSGGVQQLATKSDWLSIPGSSMPMPPATSCHLLPLLTRKDFQRLRPSFEQDCWVARCQPYFQKLLGNRKCIWGAKNILHPCPTFCQMAGRAGRRHPAQPFLPAMEIVASSSCQAGGRRWQEVAAATISNDPGQAIVPMPSCWELAKISIHHIGTIAMGFNYFHIKRYAYRYIQK